LVAGLARAALLRITDVLGAAHAVVTGLRRRPEVALVVGAALVDGARDAVIASGVATPASRAAELRGIGVDEHAATGPRQQETQKEAAVEAVHQKAPRKKR